MSKKRFLAAVLSLTMVCSAVVVPVYAEDDVSSGDRKYHEMPMFEDDLIETAPESDEYLDVSEELSEEVEPESEADDTVQLMSDETSGKCGENLTWVLDDDGTLTISGTGAMTNWSSDSKVPWYSKKDKIKIVNIENSVTSIGKNAFHDCGNLIGIANGKGIKSIGDSAFSYCGGLKSVTIPSGVTSIGNYAFSHCSNITNLIIANKVVSIGNYAFRECDSITSIEIPSGVKNIGNGAFSECENLAKINISEGIETIGSSAFSECEELTSVTIPSSVTSIGTGAFDECNSLEIYVNNENKNYSSLDGVLFNKDKTILIQYAKGKTYPDYVIPDGVKIIGESAFSGEMSNYDSINSIIIPNSVEIISRCAFYGTDIENITIPNSVTTIDESAFERCTNLISVSIPDSVTYIGEDAFYLCQRLSQINWNVKQIDTNSYVFSGDIGIYSDGITVTLGDNVEKVPSSFLASSNIKNVYISSNVKSIGQYSFSSSNDFDFFVDASNTIYSSYDGILFNKEKTEIIKFAKSKTYPEYSIPDSVTEINNYAFSKCGSLTTITIPDSVKEIGDYAFSNCDSLTEITISENVKSIGDKAFFSCPALRQINWNAKSGEDFSYGSEMFSSAGTESGGICITFGNAVEKIPSYLFKAVSIKEINIGENVTDIGEYAFYGCTGLSSIAIGENTTNIGNHAFYECTGLTNVIISDNVKNIGEYAFYGCTGLSSITIGESTTNIGNRAFYECTALTQINWNAKNVNDFLCDDFVFEKAGRDSEGITVIFGEKVEKIPEYLFYNSYYYGSYHYNSSSNIVSATTIGKKIKNIGEYSFYQTPYYENGDNWTDGVLYMGNYLIDTTNNIADSYKIKDSTYAIADGAFESCDKLTSISIPSSVTSIGSSAFNGCSAVTNITIPDNVTYIGEWAFDGCTEISSINIPNSVTHIGEGAFYGCKKLSSINIPDTVESIGGDLLKGTAYYNDETNWNNDSLYIGNHLISVKSNVSDSYSIRSNTKTIAGNAFLNCSEITNITIPDSVIYIGESAFFGCSKLLNISIPSTISEIADSTFYGCSSLKNINIGENIIKIGNCAFDNCSALTEVIIPDSVQSIGDFAFSACSALIKVKLPKNITTIGDSTFSDCETLSDIEIPNSVTKIGKSAFYDCGSLINVSMPDSIIAIDTSAFQLCTGIKSINIPRSVVSIGERAFCGLWNLEKIQWDAVNVTSFPGTSRISSNTKNSSCVFLNAGKNSNGVTVTFGDSVKRIPSYAFCSIVDKDKNINLKSVNFSDSITAIGGFSFAFCDGLDELTLPKHINSLGFEFIRNTNIKNISIPSSVTYADEDHSYSSVGPLSGINLQTVTIEEGMTALPSNMFLSSSIENIILPKSIGSLNANPFYQCRNLGNIFVDEKNPHYCSIDGVLFMKYRNTYDLVSYPTSRTGNYVLPENVIYIRDYAFAGSELSSISIPDNVTSIGEHAFSRCSNLTNIILPDNIKEIEKYTFSSCSSLESIFISNSVNLINEGAFYECGNLKDIYFSGSKSEWENIIIYNDESINNVIIHYNATSGGSTPEPDLPEEVTINEVRRLKAYDAQTSKLQFNDGSYNAVDDAIDYESLVGKFVLIELKSGELISIVPVNDGYGSISEINGDNVVIDGKTYTVDENIKSYWISPSEIPIHYFTIDNVLVDIAYLNTKTGTLEAIDSNKGEITIDGNIYIISSFVDLPVDNLNNHLNREIQYKADSVYDIYGITEVGGSELLSIWDVLAQNLNSNIEINSNGKAYARFVLKNKDGNTLKNTTVSYKFKGYDEAYTTTTDDVGMVTVETPILSGNDETITMEVIFTASTELKQNTYSFDVRINPLSFSQTWKGKLYGDLGVGAAIGIGGEIGTSANKIEAEAKLGSIGANFKPAKTFSVTNSLNNGTRTLVFDNKLDATVAANAKVGMYAEAGIGSGDTAKKVNLTAADLSGKAEYGDSIDYSLKLENYDPSNMEQNLKAARFLFDSAIGINGSNVILRKALELWDAESYNENGETQTIKLGAGANVASASIGSIGATLVGLSADSIMTSGTSVDSNDKTTHSSGISTSSGVKIGDIKYKETNNNKNLQNVDDASLGTTVFGKSFLNNEATISATSNDNVADKISVKSVKANNNNSIFWYKDIESDYSKLTFKEENAKKLADEDENINKLAKGEKSFFTTLQMTDSVENILYSGFDADYSEEKSIERGIDASIGFGLTALIDVDLGIGLSGVKKTEYTHTDGMMSQNTIYTTSESDIANEVKSNEKELTEILSEPIVALKDKVMGLFESIAGAVKDGVEWGKAKIIGAKDWICTITSFNEDSQSVSSYSILAVENEVSLFSTSSIASTVGEPYVVKVTDTNNNEITDFSESPLTLTLSYDNNDLAAAGVENNETELEKLKVYYWNSEKSVYVYIGGALDFANSSVSVEILKPGQYILAIDNCPPTVTEFSVSDGSGNPSISAVVADMSGISDFEFKIDDTIIVNMNNLYDYYIPSTAVFEHKVTDELPEGAHTASIMASDTSGNSMEEPIVINFTVDNTAPMVQNVAIPELVVNGTMNVTAEASDDNLTDVFTCIEYGGQIYRYEMTGNNDFWSVEINNLPDFADMKVWVVAYDSVGNSSESVKVSSRTALQPTEESEIYIGISEINQDSVKVIINQSSDKTFDGQLILAGFDNNRCQEVKAVDYTSNIGCHDLDIPINEIHSEFRLFYWDNLDGMVPLCTHYTTNSN